MVNEEEILLTYIKWLDAIDRGSDDPIETEILSAKYKEIRAYMAFSEEKDPDKKKFLFKIWEKKNKETYNLCEKHFIHETE